MNAVNFTDGVDGLAAGVCAISRGGVRDHRLRSLQRDGAGVLALITCGAALGFLVHNFHPATIFMGDCGSNLLGLLLGAIIVEGSLKTNAVDRPVRPPGRARRPVPGHDVRGPQADEVPPPVYSADANHFHHRFARIGFSQRRTVAYLYAWTATMAAVAVALRFVPYSDDHGDFSVGWTVADGRGRCLIGLAASFYVVYTLEILKLKRFRMRDAPGTGEYEIERRDRARARDRRVSPRLTRPPLKLPCCVLYGRPLDDRLCQPHLPPHSGSRRRVSATSWAGPAPTTTSSQ